MKDMKNVLNQNKMWAEKMKRQDPSFFSQLAKTQTPEILWIGNPS
jgi:carbonic anhydrase